MAVPSCLISAASKLGCLLGAWAVWYLIAVLFGAPLLSAQAETGAFAGVQALLTGLPALFVCANWWSWARLYLDWDWESRAELRALATSLGAAAGAWLGAIPIPLDWDRWWQEWPITCVVGGVLGAIVGAGPVTQTLLYYVRVRAESSVRKTV